PGRASCAGRAGPGARHLSRSKAENWWAVERAPEPARARRGMLPEEERKRRGCTSWWGTRRSGDSPARAGTGLAAEQRRPSHAYRQAVRHLAQDGAMRAVGDFRRQLDAAIDRSWCQQHQVRLRPSHSLAVHPEQARILLDRREQSTALPLELDAQHVHHIAARQDVVEAIGDLDAEALNRRGYQRRWPAHDDPRAELQQSVDVAARHATVRDVADQADGQPLDAPLELADGEDVE